MGIGRRAPSTDNNAGEELLWSKTGTGKKEKRETPWERGGGESIDWIISLSQPASAKVRACRTVLFLWRLAVFFGSLGGINQACGPPPLRGGNQCQGERTPSTFFRVSESIRPEDLLWFTLSQISNFYLFALMCQLPEHKAATSQCVRPKSWPSVTWGSGSPTYSIITSHSCCSAEIMGIILD